MIHTEIAPISDLYRNSRECLSRIMRTGLPLVLTIHGRPAGVLMSMDAYQKLVDSRSSPNEKTE